MSISRQNHKLSKNHNVIQSHFFDPFILFAILYCLGLPQPVNRNASFPSRVLLPSRLVPLSPNSPAVQRGYGQIVANYPPPPLQQHGPLSPFSPTQPPLAYRPALRPIQPRPLPMQSRPLPRLTLPGLQMHVPPIQPMEVANDSLASSPQSHSHGDIAKGVSEQQPSVDAVDSPVSQKVAFVVVLWVMCQLYLSTKESVLLCDSGWRWNRLYPVELKLEAN